jgi:2-phosphosulfolactate phosphatase
MSEKRQIKVCLTPALFPLYADRESIVVAVDILRATSAMCTAMHYGVSKIIPVSTVEEALDYKGREGYILAAERNGKMVPGFDFGNSPLQYCDGQSAGKTLVLTTTNGTKSINIAKQDHQVVIGSFLNIDALTDWLSKQEKNVVILCAGWKGDFCFEDALFAGALTEKLLKTKLYESDSDSANGSRMIYIRAKEDMFRFLGISQHRKRLAHLDIIEDVKYCLQENTTNVVPILEGDQLILAE